jgi:poly(3-hydroxybutyrate) depolymerase
MDRRRVLVSPVLVTSVVGLAVACGIGRSGATAPDEPLGCEGLEAPESGVFDPAGRPGAIVHVPGSYDPTVADPVVLVFHGANVSPAAIERLTGFSDLSDAEGFLAVYPSGQEEITPQPGLGWSPARTRDGVDLSDRQRDLADWLLGDRCRAVGFGARR